MQKKALVCGAGGFIGTHLVIRLKNEGYWVRAVDVKYPEYCYSVADEFIIGDLREQNVCRQICDMAFDEIYQLAADMGGAGYIFTGENDANVMHNSALINLNMVERCYKTKSKKIFYSSSACIYPAYNQLDPANPLCTEESAYPAAPDSEYGWEKLFSERLYLSFGRNYKVNARIARFHNIFGPLGTWRGGKEKAPAAICRKVAQCKNGDSIEIWGDGKQTRSFLYVDECVDGILRIMNSSYTHPVNLGSDEMISINDLAKLIIEIAGKNIEIRNISGPVGVAGRNSDNKLIEATVHWSPTLPLKTGLERLYAWVSSQVATVGELKKVA